MHFSDAFPCVTAPQAQATRSDGRYTALDLLQVPKVPTRASAAAAPQVKMPAADPSAAMVKVAFRHLSRIYIYIYIHTYIHTTKVLSVTADTNRKEVSSKQSQ